MSGGETDYHRAARVDAAAPTDRSFCTTCGWLLPAGVRATCAACGGDATPLPLTDNTRPRDEDEDPALASAREAWSHGEHARAIGLALMLGQAPRTFSTPQGPGWIAAVGATPVFALLDVALSQVTLEVPVVRLPQTKRVPALRAALALCNEIVTASRFCLRIDLLVTRFAARLDALSPAIVHRVAREMVAVAYRAQGHLTLAFDARPAVPEQGVLSAWDRLGRSQMLPLLAPPSLAAPMSQAQPASSARPSSRPSMRPMALAPPPAQAQPRAITLRLSIPPVLAPDEDDDMPAVLAPWLDDGAAPRRSDMADDRPSPPSIPPTIPPPALKTVPPDTPPSRPSMLPSALPHVPALGGMRTPFPNAGAMRALTPSEIEPPPATRRPLRVAPQDLSTSEGKLCELLRQALSLATVLSFQERPHTTLLLVRAAVFRALHEHVEAVPHAVAYLYRATRGITREVWTTRQDPTRATGPLPLAEPALGALEQIITARGTLPKEKPAAVDGWTTAQQAKEQLGKYLGEIEIAPADPTLRHYLALGALSELLVRTRLPPATDQRLREIVAFGQRDGAKPHVVELMMTALRKIVTG
jgi:hypothetical protein